MSLRASRLVVTCDGSCAAVSRPTLFLRPDRRTIQAPMMRAMTAVTPSVPPMSGTDCRKSATGAADLCSTAEGPSGGAADAGAAGGVALSWLSVDFDWTCGATAKFDASGAAGEVLAGAGGKAIALVGTQYDSGCTVSRRSMWVRPCWSVEVGSQTLLGEIVTHRPLATLLATQAASWRLGLASSLSSADAWASKHPQTTLLRCTSVLA